MEPEIKQFEPLSHQRGYAYHVINPMLDYWLESWYSTHPLLDVGCGSCTNAYQATEAGITVYATESERESVKALTKTHKDKMNISFHYLHFPDHVPFEDNSFSGILCSEVLHFWTIQKLLHVYGNSTVS